MGRKGRKGRGLIRPRSGPPTFLDLYAHGSRSRTSWQQTICSLRPVHTRLRADFRLDRIVECGLNVIML